LFIGLSAFGSGDDDNGFYTMIASNVFNKVKLNNMELDEIFATSDTSIDNFLRQEWDENTLFLGKFENSLEAGNVDNNNIPIEYLIIKKRKKTDLTWQDIYKITFDINISKYEYIDNLVQANQTYEYALVPVTANVIGEFISAEVKCEFDGTFVVDKNESYQFLYNLEYGDIINNSPATVINTFSKYPTVLYSGEIDYKSGKIKSLVLSNDFIDSGQVDYISNRTLTDNLIKFLKNKKPKILKDASGRYYMIAVLGEPTESPNNVLNQSISEVSFSWVECGDANDAQTLIDNGFIYL
jgi:hypothetical protein